MYMEQRALNIDGLIAMIQRYAHNNMYGLTLFSMARMFEEASAASSNGDGSNGAAKDDEECDTLRTGQGT